MMQHVDRRKTKKGLVVSAWNDTREYLKYYPESAGVGAIIVAIAAFSFGVTTHNQDELGAEATALTKAAQADGFDAISDVSPLRGDKSRLTLHFGKCAFSGVEVSVVGVSDGEKDITAYTFFGGESELQPIGIGFGNLGDLKSHIAPGLCD